MTFSGKNDYIILMLGFAPISFPFSDHAALHYCDCAWTATLPRLQTFFRRCSAIIRLTFAPDWSLTSGGRCNLLPLSLDYLLQFTQWLANAEWEDSRLPPEQKLPSPVAKPSLLSLPEPSLLLLLLLLLLAVQQPHERRWCASGTHDVGTNPRRVQQPRCRRPTRASARPNLRASFTEQLAPNPGHVPLDSPWGGYSCVCVQQSALCIYEHIVFIRLFGWDKNLWGKKISWRQEWG